MARKKYTAEQIINHLREAEIIISKGLIGVNTSRNSIEKRLAARTRH
jgi:hypothetical protein